MSTDPTAADQFDEYDGADDYDDVDTYGGPPVYTVDTEAPRPQNRRGPAPRNMSRAPRPRDHRKPRKRPQVQREAEGDDTIPIDYRGHTYNVPADQDDWSLDAMEAFEKNHMFAGVSELLGPQQWAQFKARHNNRRAFREFLDEVADIFGFGTTGN